MAGFPLREDIELVRDLLGRDMRTLSADMGLSRMTLDRWLKDPRQASGNSLETFYDFAFGQGIRLTEIHAQLFMEESRNRGLVPLFHGSKSGIEGALALERSRSDNDFGKGFYCGESYRQAASFVGRFQNSICYFVSFDENVRDAGHGNSALVKADFSVDDSWMLAVSYHRGKLGEYAAHPHVRSIADEVEAADYVIAPIADNRMFDIIDSFVAGEISDVQCRHCLSATNLGLQYVLRSRAALGGVMKLQPHYLCALEKHSLLEMQRESARVGSDKVRVAKRKYRNQGRYIEELLS